MDSFLLSFLSFLSFIIIFPTQIGGQNPVDTENVSPVAISHSATFFAEAKCQGKPNNPIVNFGCSAQCFPTGGAHSVLLHGPNFHRWSEWKAAPHSWHEGALGRGDRNNIADRGPLAVAYGFSDCRKDSMIGRARIRPTRIQNCVTFSEPVFGWSLKLQWMCQAQRNRYNKHYDGDYHEEEYWNWREPEPGQVEKWRELDALNRANQPKKKPEPAFDHSGDPADPEGELDFNLGVGNLDPSEIEDPGGKFGSSSGVGELIQPDEDLPSRIPDNGLDSDWLDSMFDSSNNNLDGEDLDQSPFEKTFDFIGDVLPVPED